jgi:hypothetical protein
MRKIIILAICAFVVAALGVSTPAEAKKHRPHISHNVGKKFARHASHDIRHAYRAGRVIRNIGIATGIGAGIAALSRNCNHYYRRYQETGDPRWRNKYNACIR